MLEQEIKPRFFWLQIYSSPLHYTTCWYTPIVSSSFYFWCQTTFNSGKQCSMFAFLCHLCMCRTNWLYPEVEHTSTCLQILVLNKFLQSQNVLALCHYHRPLFCITAPNIIVYVGDFVNLAVYHSYEECLLRPTFGIHI